VRKTIPAEHAVQDPRTSELAEAYLAPLGIEAMLDAPILLDGEVIGVVCHEHVHRPREWTTEERDFAGSVADCVALKIKGAEIIESQRIRQLDAERQAAYRQRDGIANLAAGVAHDFRNLLTIVTGSARELKLVADRPPDVAELADTILAAAARGANLASQLMELAREHAGNPQVLDVVEATERVLDLLQQAAGPRHRVELSGAPFAGHVFLDPHHLERILLNLVVNARDAMTEGGLIRVTFHDGRPDDPAPENHEVLLEVRDTGPGIPPEILPRIFEPFFSTKPRHEGSGLGLAVVRHLVELIGGTVEVESRVGEGTAFRLRLPRVAGGTAPTG
jgi:signal transduction histidine kinase